MDNIFTKAMVDYYNLITQDLKKDDVVADDKIDAVVWMFANLIQEIKDKEND